MPPTIGQPPARSKWGKRIVMTFGCVVVAAFIIGFFISRVVKCEDIEEPALQSPDGKWLVKSILRSCPAGPLSVTNYDVFVILSAQQTISSAKYKPERIFENDGSSDPPGISWPSANTLVIEVNGEGVVKVSRHEFASVAINYMIPKGLRDNLDKIETDRLQKNRESEELYKSGKMSIDDLRVSLQVERDSAEEWTKFRQWASENASIEANPNNETPNRK